MKTVARKAKTLLRRSPLFAFYSRYRGRREYVAWMRAGRPPPPPHVYKQRVVKEYAAKFGLRVFFETGTYLGDMVYAVKDCFDEVYSIELSRELFEQATTRFAEFRSIRVLHGDSAQVLPELLQQMKNPALFWLDGHHSGGSTARGQLETPIQRELAAIGDHPLVHRHVVLVDDARYLVGAHDYPSLESVRTWAAKAGFDVCEVKDDILRIHQSA